MLEFRKNSRAVELQRVGFLTYQWIEGLSKLQEEDLRLDLGGEAVKCTGEAVRLSAVPSA